MSVTLLSVGQTAQYKKRFAAPGTNEARQSLASPATASPTLALLAADWRAFVSSDDVIKVQSQSVIASVVADAYALKRDDSRFVYDYEMLIAVSQRA